ncbi:hypothetical protein MAM1_0071c04155 [Mucor ambiguus]|uniref:BTB domain-containing protein n=1 Tax=Mucor ambiguus TaxID=91626 RepID=A0A0C9M599_9FUNG|nr:hypothetical protein MAM1_0071c04155 [Mucor ambiguus]
MDKNSKLITLNVGGKKFITFCDTLKQSTYLQKLTETKKGDQASIIQKENEQIFFIDRDGEVFEEIMHYLRSFEIRVDTVEDLEKLKIEATFFDVKELVLEAEQTLLSISDASDDATYCLELPENDAQAVKMNFSGSMAANKTNQRIIKKFSYIDKEGSSRVVLVVEKINENY